MIAPDDRFVKIIDARKEAGVWKVTLEATPPVAGAPEDAERSIQVEATAGCITRIELDGRPLALESRIEGDQVVRCRLARQHTFQVSLS